MLLICPGSLLRKADARNLHPGKIANHPGYVLRQITDHHGNQVHRWVRVGSALAGDTRRNTTSPEAILRDAITAMRQVPIPIFSDTSQSNRDQTRRTTMLQQMAASGNIDGITNFTTSRTRANYSRVADYREALMAAYNRAMEPITGSAERIRPATLSMLTPLVSGSNMANGALISAQRKCNAIFRAATMEADPVAAILGIQTSRTNPYTRAADDYRSAMLRHFGYQVDGTPLPGMTPDGTTPPMPVNPLPRPEPTPPPPRPEPALPPGVHRATNPIPGSANPSNCTEAELGFIPRPNLPLSCYLSPTYYHDNRAQTGARLAYPTPEMAALARRYCAQRSEIYARAQDYQRGTWRPPTPIDLAAARRQQQEDAERIRQSAQHVLRNIQQSDLHRPINEPGRNVREIEHPSEEDKTIISQAAGVPYDTLVDMAKIMIADYKGNTRFNIKIKKLGPKSFDIAFTGNDNTFTHREFYRETNGMRVYHAYFRAGSNGDNSSKAYFRTSMGVYKALGVKKITVGANIDVGGYAWGRWGFRIAEDQWPGRKNAIKERLTGLLTADYSATTRDGRTTTARQIDRNTYNKLMAILDEPGNNGRETFWKIIDAKPNGNPIGQAIHLHTGWTGKFDMEDRVHMDRFCAYAASDPDFIRERGRYDVSTGTVAPVTTRRATPRRANG